ncbi:long-chain-fatty-acid--CoA ligase [Pseudonocardia sp. D17]|uniref:long-chain-fatty-acid--CoA ligase n=1 Tax=Pseudonocardia sp. D17 TaxID=882661 RepID=UPI002B38E068|nr:long-chain-fatty-acid--CoA ligase [Pseudonocardia sp. D17]
MTLNLAMMLRESAQAHPHRTAIVLDDERLSYADLDAATDRFAAGLVRHGVRPGDVVAIQLPNVPQFAIAHFGILKAGAVVVPVNVLLKAREVAYVLGDSAARTLITWGPVAAEAAKGAADAGVSDVVVLGDTGDGAGVGSALPFGAFLVHDDGPVLEQREPGDVAVIMYTAGTTGAPKGAELTHFQLFMNADTPGRLFGIRDDDVVLVALPLFHVYALSSQLHVCVRFAATMTLLPRFDAGRALEVVERDGVTVFEGVPAMYIALLAHPDRDARDTSSLRVGISGGAPIPAEVLDEFEHEFGVVVLEGYGLTETASTTTFNVSAEERRVYSVGKPVYGVEVRICDDAGRRLPPGHAHVGEILVRGVNVMRGYRGRPHATAEAFAGGWFHTGDLGFVDPDGFLFVVDRKSDLIIRGGYNVYPREVEDVLHTHPAVREAAVVGIADPRLGQEAKAVVSLREGMSATEDEIIEFVRERMATYKYPRSVEFRDSLPKGVGDKILKRAL